MNKEFLPERHEPYSDSEYAFTNCRQQRLEAGKDTNDFHHMKEGDVVVVRIDGRKLAGRYYSKPFGRDRVEFDGRDDYYLPNDPCLKGVTEVIGEFEQTELVT